MPSRISEQAEMPACLSDFLRGNSGADQGFYQGTAACVIDADFAGLVLQTHYGAVDLLVVDKYALVQGVRCSSGLRDRQEYADF